MTKPNIFDLVLITLLSAILMFFIWSTYWLKVELQQKTLSHANFVVHCRNTVAVLSEQARPARCSPRVKAVKKVPLPNIITDKRCEFECGLFIGPLTEAESRISSNCFCHNWVEGIAESNSSITGGL